MSKRILLTGGTAFVGGSLVHRLLKERYEIKFLARERGNQSVRTRIEDALSPGIMC